jgi:hypothetical protein
MGGDEGGHTLYLKDNKLVYSFNYYAYYHYEIASTSDVPTGNIQLKTEDGLQVRRWRTGQRRKRNIVR